MAFGQKIIPFKGVNVDVHESLLPPDQARFIKNLAYSFEDSSTATSDSGGKTGAWKPLQANEEYLSDLVLPDGVIQTIGGYSHRDTREVIVAVINEKNQHTIYRINGMDQTSDIVYQNLLLNFQLQPQHFIHFGGSVLVVIYLTDPATGEKVRRSFWFFTDGFNPPRRICMEDAIATNGFSIPFFNGNYDRNILINMGVPTPKDCIKITEVPNNETHRNNKMLYNTWQFRLMDVDVWGEPSEHGIISDLYIPGGDCLGSSSNLPRCVDLEFNAPPPHIDKVQVEYRNCNDQQWYVAEVLDLYDGSVLGRWWERQRNPSVQYDSGNNKITYRFCADKECRPIPPAETNRLGNPLPRISQAVSQIGKFIGLSNNKDGFLPFSKTLKDKIVLTVEPPSADAAAVNSFRNIEVYVPIYNPFRAEQGVVHSYINKYWFGYLPTSDSIYDPFGKVQYEQSFANATQKGFIGYLAGTKSLTISEQWSLDVNGVWEKVTDFRFFDKTKKYFQKFSFSNIPKGKYLFRIAAHNVDPAQDANWNRTSTYVGGSFPLNWNNQNPIDHYNFVSEAKELLIDVCDKNYTSLEDNKILVVWDFSYTGAMVASGYVYNTDAAGESQYGVELLQFEGGDGMKKSNFTDHNGFYFTASQFNRFRFRVYGYCNCQRVELFNGRVGRGSGVHRENFYLNKSFACVDYETQECNHILIKGKVKLCNSNIAVPNVVVVLARGRSGITDSDGEFTIIAHDDVLNPLRIDNLYFITNSCSFTDCDGNCLEPVEVRIQKCVTCEERIVEVGDTEVSFISQRGLLTGGTYPVGAVGWDWLGRPTFVQRLKDLTIPSVQETRLFSPSKVRVDILADAVFPAEFEYITFFVGEETTVQDYVTWIVDKVEFIDNTGLVNDDAPTQIKIYYASLLEYNKQHNYNTTVNWQFIDEVANTPVVTDRVEFFLNGDGTFFDKSITELVRYAKDGQYFLINYNDALKDLKQNAIIRIVRPKKCVSIGFDYEVCSTINLVNGRPEISSFYLNAFDTYYQNRQIPVPVLSDPEDAESAVNELRLFGVPFEHHSPSDFWGYKCKNVGRAHSINPYETEIYHEDQIALSGAMSENGVLNYLSYFDDSKKIDFSDTKTNGIVAAIAKPGIVAVIGQSNNFVVGFSDNVARINEQGQVVAGSVKDQFGQPQAKSAENYGCLLFDKNTIYEMDGLIQWLDATEAAVIQQNFHNAVAISHQVCDSYIRPKIKAVQEYNRNNEVKRYFHGIIDPATKGYLLSDHIIKSAAFINNLREYDVESEETVCFAVLSKSFRGWYSFVPEFYAELKGEKNNSQLFAFKNGVPYRHYSTLDNKRFNIFFGEKVNRVVEVVIVIDNLKKKKPLSLGVICKESLYFCDRAVTETNQETRMLKAHWRQAEFGWYAPFLCSLNTLPDKNRKTQTEDNKILDGDLLVGNFIKVRLIGDPDKDSEYSELQGLTASVFPNANNLIPK